MEDETFQHNQDLGRLVHLIQQIPGQIENIEHDVSSTKNTVDIISVKLDDLIGKLERRDFLDNPSLWPTGAIERNVNDSNFGTFP